MGARVVGAGTVNGQPEWSECCWPKCHRLAEGGGPPLCEDHYHQVGFAWLTEHGPARITHVHREPDTRHAEHLARRDAAMKAQSQVYYVRIGDHVKIGYSINMRQRLGALRVDDDALLATEPGGRELESQRHRQFAAERVGKRENFNPSPRLLEHIEAVKAEHGLPRITSYTSEVA